jgi:Tfp pilus assembly protein PilF
MRGRFGTRWPRAGALATVLLVANLIPSAGGQERRIERVKKGEAAKGSGGRWGLVVGVDRYESKDIEPLSGAVADAKAIRDVLIKYADFPEAQVTLLVSDGAVKPTAGNIMDRLEEIKKAAAPTDLLLFFFAGHGVQVDGQRYLLTYEANIASTGRLKTTSLPATALMQELEAVRVAHRVLMVDACRNDPTKPGHQPNLADEAFENAFTLQPTSEGGVRATFLSSSKGQSAYEWTEKHRGFFSYFVEKGLSGEAAQYGKVTVTSLLTYLNEMVPQKVREQKNQLQVPYAKVDGSELVLVRGEKLPAQTATLDKQPVVALARTIYGVVKDSSGMPLPGVTVTVALAGAGSRAAGGKPAPPVPELKLTTDEDGFFKADGVAPDSDVKVTASKDSYLPKTLVSAPAEAGKKLVMFLPRTEPAKPVRVAEASPAPLAVPPPVPPPPLRPVPVPVAPAPVTPAPATPAPATPAPVAPSTLPARPSPVPAPTPKPPEKKPEKRPPAPPTTQPAALVPAPVVVPPPVPVLPPAPLRSRGSELALVAYRTFLAEDFGEAENAAKAALEVEPDSALANAVLGNATLALGVNTGDAHRTAAAREFIDKALGRDPELALGHNARGLALLAAGKYGEAIPELQKAIQSDSKLAPAHANLAYALDKQNRLDEAEREYREAIRLSPESSVPFNGLSAVLFSKGKFKDAVKACREAISRYQLRDRFLGRFYVQLAIAQFQQGHQEEAMEAIARAKALGMAQDDAYTTIEKGKPAKKKS